jgi:hypothetical protein
MFADRASMDQRSRHNGFAAVVPLADCPERLKPPPVFEAFRPYSVRRREHGNVDGG